MQVPDADAACFSAGTLCDIMVVGFMAAGRGEEPPLCIACSSVVPVVSAARADSLGVPVAVSGGTLDAPLVCRLYWLRAGNAELPSAAPVSILPSDHRTRRQ